MEKVSFEEIIIARLDRLENKIDANSAEHIQLGREVAALKVKSGIWGGLSGLFGALVIAIGWVFGR